MIEKSNVYLREQVNYLQFAKPQIEVAQKLINTNKQPCCRNCKTAAIGARWGLI
ncbi:MAG: hypothetical protein R2857_14850 [Vampirovibrionales bacterium]